MDVIWHKKIIIILFLSKNKKGVRGSMEMIMVCNYLFLGRVGRESVKDNNQAREIEIDSFKLIIYSLSRYFHSFKKMTFP